MRWVPSGRFHSRSVLSSETVASMPPAASIGEPPDRGDMGPGLDAQEGLLRRLVRRLGQRRPNSRVSPRAKAQQQATTSMA